MSAQAQDITKYFNYTTMTDFMKELGEPDLEGVFTVRLTPTKDILKDPSVETFIKTLEANPAIKKILAFKESSPRLHYHIRLVTQYKTRKSIADLIKKTWCWTTEKEPGLSNKIYSVHDCKSKDKTLWKSATYIAKEGDCVNHYGYKPCHVAKFVQYSRRLRKFKDTPKYKRIIYLYNLRQSDSASQYYDAIIDYHKMKKLEIPEKFRINNLMHNICFNLSLNYRNSMKESLIESFNFRLNGLW